MKGTESYVTIDRAEDDAIVLVVNYDGECVFRPDFRQSIIEQTLGSYEERKEELKDEGVVSCVVVVATEVGSSPLITGLFLLWELVRVDGGGELVCASFPSRYEEGLRALGMFALEGFSTATDKESGLEMLRGNG